MSPFTEEVIRIIQNIPKGKVMTYGQIAGWAGNPRGARQVVWCLRSYSEKMGLPWYRVINSKGVISLPEGAGKEEQQILLEKEGINIDLHGKIDLKTYLYSPEKD